MREYRSDIHGTVEAVRWYERGDYDQELDYPDGDPDEPCWQCGSLPHLHCVVEDQYHRTSVCPGDWIVRRKDGRISVMRQEKFQMEYR